MQRKLFKFLPVVFLFVLYNFAAGLVLYWTVQNLLTILQQRIINRQPDEPIVAQPIEVKKTRTGKGGNPSTKPKRR